MRNGFVYLVIVVAVMAVLFVVMNPADAKPRYSYSELLDDVAGTARSGASRCCPSCGCGQHDNPLRESGR